MKNLYTSSTTNYLYAIRSITKELGYCRAVDISKKTGITPWSTSTALKLMIKKGMIELDKNKIISLTMKSELDLNRFDDNKIKLTKMFEQYTPDDELIERNVNEIFFLLDQCLIDFIVSKKKRFFSK